MRSRGVVFIVFAILTNAELGLSLARVTFPFSEVIPVKPSENSYLPTFNCAEQCAVYTTKDATIYQSAYGDGFRKGGFDSPSSNDKVFTTIILTTGTNTGGTILEAGNYTGKSSQSYYNSQSYYILYVVKVSAPNFGAPVYALQENSNDMAIDTQKRYFTILTNSNAMELYNFSGNFPQGYPKVYAAGFDALSAVYGATSCRPVYEARSQLNAEQSSPVVFAPIFTVDFGFHGDHSVSVKPLRYVYGEQKKSAGASIVYMSPGHTGCPFVGTQIYDDSERESTARDSFTIIASSLNISLSSYFDGYPRRSNKFRVNRDNLDFSPTGPPTFSKFYGPGAYKVELEWTGYAKSSWAMQLDFGPTHPDSVPKTEMQPPSGIESAYNASVTSNFSRQDFSTSNRPNTLAPNTNRVSDQPPPPSPIAPSTWYWAWQTYGPTSPYPWNFTSVESSPSYAEATPAPQHFDYPGNPALLSMTVQIRVLHILLFLFVVALLLFSFCMYRKRRAARQFEPLAECK